MLIVILLFLLGLLLVIKGGDWFVESSVKIAEISGLPKIFIGATVVSIATTLPELIVSLTAAIKNESVMSAGNAIGSIICNTGLVLAINSISSKPTIKDNNFTIRYFYLLLGITAIFAFSIDGRISFLEGVLLFIGFTFYMYANAKYVSDNNFKKAVCAKHQFFSIILYFILGISFIIIGSNLIIKYGASLATLIGIPPSIISLTLIALGTSLPELVTCISSLIKRNSSIGIGNIIGANILNCFLVIGSSAMITEINMVNRFSAIDIPIALILTFILAPSLFSKKISKAQGIIMLCIYLTYTILSWVTSTII